MALKTWTKIGLITIVILLCMVAIFFGYAYYYTTDKFVPNSSEIFTHRVAYINPEDALAKGDLEICDENRIFDYYNPERARYSKGKNGLRKFVLSSYKNKNYSDAGYLNIRFVINCKGEAGRYIIHENDLNLEPYSFSEDLKNQLLNITVQLDTWTPNVIRGEARDSYMYLSYKIVDGEIIEILP